MGLSLFTTLLLLGSWAVLAAFLKGDRFRRPGSSVVPRATPRILTPLALLGLAAVAGLVSVVGAPADKVYPAYGALALLVLGVGTAVSALLGASPAGGEEASQPRIGKLPLLQSPNSLVAIGGEEASQPRIGKRGWTALALLSSAEVVGVLNDWLVETLNQWQGPVGARSVVPGALGLLFLVLGTGGAAWTFLARNTAAGDTASDPRRTMPRPWWTLAVLGMAVAALVLANMMFPTPAGLLGLVLLMLGTGAGLFGYLFEGRATSPSQPAILRISPRGWVCLGLLVLATGVVALEQTRAWTGLEAIDEKRVETATPEKNLAEVRAELTKEEAELRSLSTRPADGRSWDDLRGSDEPGGLAGGENDAARKLGDEVDELRLKLARLEAGPNSSQPALPSPPPPSVDLASWKWGPGSAGGYDRAAGDRTRRAMLESEVAQLRAKVTRMEAETNKAKPAPSPAAPMNVDLSTWAENARGGRQDTSAAGDNDLQPAVTGRSRVRQ
jgi:hypothetical protein